MSDATEAAPDPSAVPRDAGAPDDRDHEEDPMFEDHREAAGGFVAGLLLGAALGAVAALLLAPASGAVTRRRLRRRLAEVRDDAEDRLQALRRKARRRLAELKQE